jgi:hypothetical protein
MNTKKFNALARNLRNNPIDPGHPDQIEMVLSKAKAAGATGILITQMELCESLVPTITRRLVIAPVDSAEPPELAIIQINDRPALLISTSESSATAADMMTYLDLLTGGIPVPPFQILAAITQAVDSIHLDAGETALTFALSWGSRPNPALDGARPETIWSESERMPALIHLARLAVLARTAIAANEKMWRRSA